MRASSSSVLLAPAAAAGEHEPDVAVEQPPGADERARGSCAARACRRRARTDGRPRPHRSPSSVYPGADARVRHHDPLSGDAERRRDIGGRVRGVREHDIARACRVLVLPRVHRHRSRRAPLRVMHAARGRGSTVARRPPRCGGYIQSEKKQRIEAPEQPLGRRVAEAAPRRPRRVRPGQRPQARLDTGARRARRESGPARAGWWARSRRTSWRPASAGGERRRPSRAGSSRSPCADATAATRRRRFSSGRARRRRRRSARRACARRSSRGSTSAGTAVGETVKRTVHVPSGSGRPRSGAWRGLPGSKRTDAARPSVRAVTVCGAGEQASGRNGAGRERPWAAAQQPPRDHRPGPVAVRVEPGHRRP